MKKLACFIVAVACACVFLACSSSLDGVNNTGVGVFVPVTVDAKTVAKGGEYNEEVTIDVALADTFAEGDDVTDLFVQSTVNASSATSSARALTTGDEESVKEDDGLKNLSAVIKTLTSSSFTVTITATTLDADCTVVLTAVILPENTKSHKLVVKNVQKIVVGTGAGDSDSGSLSHSRMTIPTAKELAGKSLVYTDSYSDSDTETSTTYTFDTEGKTVTVTEVVGEFSHQEGTYTYNPTTGLLTEKKDKEDDDDIAPMDNEYLVKVDGVYYLYLKDMPLTRKSGTGFAGEFTYTWNMNWAGLATAGVNLSLTINGDGTFTGNMDVKSTAFGETIEQEDTYLSGVYINKDGLVTVKGKSTSVETQSGKTETQTFTDDFDNGYAFYTGNALYLVDYKFTVAE